MKDKHRKNNLSAFIDNNLNDNNKENQSPRPKAGFVKDMCRFYSDVLTSPSAGRSRKFATAAAVSSSPRPKSSRRRPLPPKPFALPAAAVTSETTAEMADDELIGTRTNNGDYDNDETSLRRNRTETSPTWQSVRSQDSGFSDSCESGGGGAQDNSPDFNVYQVCALFFYLSKIRKI